MVRDKRQPRFRLLVGPRRLSLLVSLIWVWSFGSSQLQFEEVIRRGGMCPDNPALGCVTTTPKVYLWQSVKMSTATVIRISCSALMAAVGLGIVLP